MRVALLHYTVPPVVGGVEEVVRQQALLLRRHGIEVRVLAGEGEPIAPDISLRLNPLWGSSHLEIEAAQRALLRGEPGPWQQLRRTVYEELSRALEGCEVLIAHNVLTMRYNLPLTWAVHELARSGRLAVVGWCHDSLYFYPVDPRWQRPPFDLLKRYNEAVHYVTISQARRRQFQELFGSEAQIEVIPNGIAPVDFLGLHPGTVRLLAMRPLLEADLVLLHTARLHPRKNVELSLYTLHALLEEEVAAQLVVTGAFDPHGRGQRAYHRRLQALRQELALEEHVVFLADWAREQGRPDWIRTLPMRDLYLLADVLFLPSLQEGFGLPLLEAGLCKVPVVCSTIPPLEELGGVDVFSFEVGASPQRIARLVLRAVGESKPQRLFRRVLKEHTWEAVYRRRLAPLLEAVITGAPR